MPSALPGSSIDGSAQPQSDAGPSIEAFIQSMLITGHRLAVDFKSYENMLSRLDHELAKDPGNPNFKDEIRRKRENRDSARSEIEALSRELADSLRLALEPNVMRSGSHAPEVRHLENQTQQIQRTTDEARREMVDVVNKLQNNYRHLVDEISALRVQVEDVKPLVPANAFTAPNANTDELQAIKSALASLADKVTELHRNFIITLSVDIPASLKEAVRLIQDCADKSAKKIIESSHHQYGAILKEFCDEYGSRIAAIEKNMSKNTSSTAIIPTAPSGNSWTQQHLDAYAQDQNQSSLEGRSQSQVQEPPLSRDPRRRHTSTLMEIDRPPGSNISALQSAPPDSDSECKQQ